MTIVSPIVLKFSVLTKKDSSKVKIRLKIHYFYWAGSVSEIYSSLL